MERTQGWVAGLKQALPADSTSPTFHPLWVSVQHDHNAPTVIDRTDRAEREHKPNARHNQSAENHQPLPILQKQQNTKSPDTSATKAAQQTAIIHEKHSYLGHQSNLSPLHPQPNHPMHAQISHLSTTRQLQLSKWQKRRGNCHTCCTAIQQLTTMTHSQEICISLGEKAL